MAHVPTKSMTALVALAKRNEGRWVKHGCGFSALWKEGMLTILHYGNEIITIDAEGKRARIGLLAYSVSDRTAINSALTLFGMNGKVGIRDGVLNWVERAPLHLVARYIFIVPHEYILEP